MVAIVDSRCGITGFCPYHNEVFMPHTVTVTWGALIEITTEMAAETELNNVCACAEKGEVWDLN